MNPCATCGDSGDPRIVGPYKRPRGQCGECGREGPTRKTFAGAVQAWDAANPSTTPIVLGPDCAERSRIASRIVRERAEAGVPQFTTTKRTPVEEYRRGI